MNYSDFNQHCIEPFLYHWALIDPDLWHCSLMTAIEMYLFPSKRDYLPPYTTSEDSTSHVLQQEDDFYANLDTTFKCCNTYHMYNCNNNSNESIYSDPNKDHSTHSLVINLSSTHLNDDAIAILSKGMKFCPTPGEPDLSQAQKDLDAFHLRIKRHLHFSSPTPPADSNHSQVPRAITQDDPNVPFKHQTFKNPSAWVPPPCVPLEVFIAQNNSDLLRSPLKAPRRHNITPAQRQTIRDLFSNPEIVIKPADKGGATVIWDKQDYIKEGLRQLSDQAFYHETDLDLSKSHFEEIKTIVDKMVDDDEIDRSCASFLTNYPCRTAQFYMLPKIHKRLDNPPGRPIVSGNNCPTEKISQFVDFFLKPIVQDTQSYIRDTTHFLNIIDNYNQLPDNTLLVTLDVSSLYTNIPNDLGIEACRENLELQRAGSKYPTNSSLIQLLEVVLTKNNFDFNNRHYLQVGGTAMGTRLAPSYANLFMDYFERKHVYTYRIQPLLWRRYIDDIFMLWTSSVQELQNFIDHLNNCIPSINFETNISESEINFLDVKVRIKNNAINTSLYTKETDTLSYLDYSSCHPASCKKSIPYSQFLRLRRICSDEDDFVTQSRKLAKSFHKAHYPDNIIQSGFDKAFQFKRDDLLKRPSNNSKTDKSDPKLFLITDYHPSFRAVLDIVSNNWDVLDNSSSTRPILQIPVVRGFRRPKNLRDLLVRARLTTADSNNATNSRKTSNKCKRPNCPYCRAINKTGRITCQFNKRSYITRFNVTCQSNNLIYCLSCKTCTKIYVGQTKRSIRERAGEHYTSIRKNKKHLVVGRHYNSMGHKGTHDVTIYILEFVRTPPNATLSKINRETQEAKWIFRLRSSVPLGLNLTD